ncbi:MAG: hypothetical protein LBD68_10605 [Zoogloeaceae bacterium]|jgi:hypothetical protein|nr:hypothetical protein [Zoogloeaceae bacterium]
MVITKKHIAIAGLGAVAGLAAYVYVKKGNRSVSGYVGGEIGSAFVDFFSGAASGAAETAGDAFLGFGGWIHEGVINPAVQAWSGDGNATLGTWLSDLFHSPEDYY